ncbi:MAG: hypothetical protein AAF441_11405 [Pseudomonadota bacterium]
MREIFLGKPFHWGLLALAAAVLWWAGSVRAHVIHFNWFLIALCLGACAMVLLVLRSTGQDEQVTRDPLPEPGEADEEVPAAD